MFICSRGPGAEHDLSDNDELTQQSAEMVEETSWPIVPKRNNKFSFFSDTVLLFDNRQNNFSQISLYFAPYVLISLDVLFKSRNATTNVCFSDTVRLLFDTRLTKTISNSTSFSA